MAMGAKITFKCVSVAIISFTLATTTSAVPINFKEWLNGALPHPGSSLKDEIKCYALPFGAIGFVSHLLTYYTIVMLGIGKSPWRWRENRHWKLDFVLSVTGLLWTLAASILTMVRCRQKWQFMLLAFWKLMLSLTLSSMAVHTALITRAKVRSQPISEAGGSFFWIILYAIGIIIGFVGLFSLVDQSWDVRSVRGFTYGWAVPTLVVCFFIAFLTAKAIPRGLGRHVSDFQPRFLGWIILITGITGALYSDWVLAAIASNYAGVPDGNNALLYWTYFGAKKLPFFSF